jgi:hypothetical protein
VRCKEECLDREFEEVKAAYGWEEYGNKCTQENLEKTFLSLKNVDVIMDEMSI